MNAPLLPLAVQTLWVTVAICAALVLVLVLVARAVRRGDSARGGPPVLEAPPPTPPADTPLAASGLVPPSPAIVRESGSEISEVDEPLLPAIPRDSTEWMEGDVREGEDVPEAALRPVPELLEALRTGEPRVCDAAVAELTRHGRAAIPALEQALIDEDPDVRVDAARALTAIRGDAD